MSNMENHVTNLEISKKLKELGVFYPCNYRWYRIHGYYGGTVEIDEFTLTSENNIVFDNSDKKVKKINRDGSLIEVQDNYNAYLATELLEILPYCINQNLFLCIDKCDGPLYRVKYIQFISEGNFDTKLEWFVDTSLPNALGKMLIYLKENKLI